MHCPQCGHGQNSDEISFCTKCGFEISDVKILLNSKSGETKAERQNERRKAAIQGFVMVMVGLGLVVILSALREFFSIPKFVIYLPFIFLMIGGVLKMALPFLSDTSNSTKGKTDSFANNPETGKFSGNQVSGKSLPAGQIQSPISFGENKYNTNELLVPISVTEETTRQLKNRQF